MHGFLALIQQLPQSPISMTVRRCDEVYSCVQPLYILWKDVSVCILGEHKQKQQHHPLSLFEDAFGNMPLFMHVDVKCI